ncbi:sensor histidine kinase [Microbacter margulisiae]|uniref:histidine kinase n=1 Tax=Microbacter margulisiae TaxID=1350067 RepID=A0A7W5DRK4_9PORP|nr:HAMP domain-containing sensor histidine kinase [Microbacter margulisiae]MBB3187782.1 two-component system phosphate regulon sensor histidine kinase PhoR [Microbacter margulisiae]
MKKTIIWVLLAIMSLTFIGIVIIQFRYISQMSQLMERQFDTNVQRSLYQVARDVEEAEATKYLKQEMGSGELANVMRSPLAALSDSIETVEDTLDTTSLQTEPRVSISGSGASSSIQATSQMYQKRFADAFLHAKKVVDVVAWRWMRDAITEEITQRINMDQLSAMLQEEFANNSVSLPYFYKITDRKGRVIYESSDSISGVSNQEGYTQRLFPNDPENAHEAFLSVYFPTKKSMLIHSMSLLLPWAVLSVILLISCLLSIILIFRQRRLNEIKNDFVSNMTHELKTPVSTISLAAQMLGDPAVSKTAETLKYYTRVIVDETKRLSFHIEKVLQMSTFERGNGNLKLTETDVNELLNMILDNFWVKVHAKHGQLRTEIQATDPFVLVDETHFTNVLYNLMDNAVKYTPTNLVLTVKTWNEKGNLCISIQDNGVGIKKEYQKRIFDKFFRVPTGNVHNVKGFGLGLAYVKQIVDAHHGTIKVESEVNIGTKFIITLPTLKNN